MTETKAELLACPFCQGEVMFRKALHISDGNTDAIIHAAPTECGMVEFEDGTTDESIITKWNTRSQPRSDEVREAVIEECAKIAADRAVRMRAKAKTQTSPSKQSYFAQSIEARVIADAIRALKSAPEGEKP